MLDVSPLSADLPFGRMIRDLTVDALADESIRESLREIWFQHGVLVFRDGDDSVEFQIRLSEVFGPLVLHQDKFLWVSGQPGLISLTADPKMDMTVEVDGEIRVGVLPWHGDARWLAEPPRGALLRVRHMPSQGGETGFIDLISTYERLPASLKKRIEGRESVVRFGVSVEGVYHFQTHKGRVLSMGDGFEIMAQRTDYPPILQPLVYVQRETGRKVLGFSPAARQQVEGMTAEESQALLHELAAYATDERYAYTHVWEKTDLVLWDNLRMLHCAHGVPPGEEREVWRTTIGGGYPIGRALVDGGFNWERVRGS